MRCEREKKLDKIEALCILVKNTVAIMPNTHRLATEILKVIEAEDE